MVREELRQGRGCLFIRQFSSTPNPTKKRKRGTRGEKAVAWSVELARGGRRLAGQVVVDLALPHKLLEASPSQKIPTDFIERNDP